MLKKSMVAGSIVGILALLSVPVHGLQLSGATISDDTKEVSKAIDSIQLPNIEQPAWLKKQIVAEDAQKGLPATTSPARKGTKTTVTYNTATRGSISANFNEFKALANRTLNDARGWSRLGIVFKEVSSGGRFTLILAQANQLPSFSSGCSAQYSCNVGNYVIINQDRWQGATPSWNNAGGSLRDYRHMVVNHEVGHWLGHGHQNCGGSGQAAPLMQQQSIDLQGCTFNPWPLASELSAPSLGL